MTAASGTSSSAARPVGGVRLRVLFPVLGVALALVGWLALSSGPTGWWSAGEVGRGLLASLGLGEPVARQVVFELRLFPLLTGLGVGGSLALAGALLQGVFRNDLASPGIIGITSGASLGATLAIVAVGGRSGALVLDALPFGAAVAVSLSALLGALALAALVTLAARRAGRVSVATLLLVGIAANATVAGFLTLIQSQLLEQFELARAVLVWGYGNLEDRTVYHARLAWGGMLAAAAIIPFVARELDLFAGGEEDAAALGVDVRRVTLLCLLGACVASASAVASAGQIGFVGLVVPHIARALVGRSHRRLLPTCLLVGPLFLVGLDVVQELTFGGPVLPTGVLMALIGGPMFFALLLIRRRELDEL